MTASKPPFAMMSPKPVDLAVPIEGLDLEHLLVVKEIHLLAAVKVAADEGIAPFDIVAEVGQDASAGGEHDGLAAGGSGLIFVFQHFQKQRRAC